MAGGGDNSGGGVIRSFPPAAAADARILILGSMPGRASLEAGEYYAHPRNLFWTIMGELAGARPCLPYPARIAALAEAGIALWDVLGECEREGSLDSAIRAEAPNDLSGFLRGHAGIRRLCFNGGKAWQSFRRHFPALAARDDLLLRPLPSTSPAHAGMSAERKGAAWREGLGV